MTWPSTVDDAVAEQLRLRDQVSTAVPAGFAPRTAAGLDVAYDGDRLAAAVCVLDLATGRTLAERVVFGHTDFPYTPGLFAFRELPALRAVLAELAEQSELDDRVRVPDVLVCDGQGLAHPRRFGLACHLGVLTGAVSIGVAKTAFGEHAEPGPARGDWAPVTHDGEVVGRALRTRPGVKPVFVSVGHRIDLDTACDLVLRLASEHRQPETTRRADHRCRTALRGA